MKSILGFIIPLVLTGVVFSAPCDSENQNPNPGIPSTSCQYSMTSYHVGLQTHGLFFIDNGESVAHGGKNYKMRFYVTSASPDYNAIQALAQTGFAFQDRLNVIFPNFSSSTNFAGSCNTLDNVKCCTNVDGEGKPAYMYCPIQAITVHK